MDYEINPAEAKAKQAAGQITLLDVREPSEWAQVKIEGSLHIPMGDVAARIQELDPDEHIVVVCHHGVRSLSVTAWLRQQGFETVQSLRGGIDRWSREVDSTLKRY